MNGDRIAISPDAYPCSFAQATMSAVSERSGSEMLLPQGLAMTTSEFAATIPPRQHDRHHRSLDGQGGAAA
jgi:hypothetical protein